MAIKKVQIIPPNYTDIIHPETQADITKYNNSNSELVATNVQSAIDEIDTKTEANKTDILTLQTQNGSEVLTTTAQTLSGAINENRTQINSLDALVGLGGIVESGTNSNGRYIKFVDGTQICVGSIRFIYGGVSVMEQNWGFPSAFTSVNYIGGSFLHAGRTTTSNASKWLGVNLQENTLSTAYFKIWSISDASIFATGETIEGYAIAIGRWK